MGAPVCNINPKSPPIKSVAPYIPSIPIAQPTLESLTVAVNAIRQILISLANQIPTSQNSAPKVVANPKRKKIPGPPSTLPALPQVTPPPGLALPTIVLPPITNVVPRQASPSGSQGGGSPADFTEDLQKRASITFNIYDPNDPTGETYVTVSQITGLSFINKITGQTLNWTQ